MSEPCFLPRAHFDRLLARLSAEGFRCVGPRARDGAIVYDDISSAADFPVGAHDRQSPGTYRLESIGSPRCFAWANGPQALKPFLFRPRQTLWQSGRADDGRLSFQPQPAQAGPLAVIGVRACDLAALALQDAHFLKDGTRDPHYAAQRERLFLVAVHCVQSAETCFCVSTGDGPRATRGFDLALSELDDGYVTEAGSARGETVLAALDLAPATAGQRQRAERELFEAAACQRRRLPSRNLRDALFANLEHPRWEDVAARCLACGNCTSVCPTCFCHAEIETPRLDGQASEHAREWDSCFTSGHSYIHGLVVRADRSHRYRQWLTHKLGSWHDQYGRSGCVGCGRCITWCPVGIDITEEAAAICGEAAHD
jgi:ferredoxin